MNINTYFNSISLTFVGLIFMGIVFVMYLRKKKNLSIFNKIYFMLIVTILIASILGLIFPLTISLKDSYEVLNNIICKIYIILLFFSNVLFLLYIYMLVFDNLKILKDGKLKPVIKYVLLGLSILIIAIVSFSNLEYIGGKGMPYTISGSLIYILNFMIIIDCVITILLININKEKIKNVYLLPMIFVLVSYIIIILLQIFNNFEVNDITFFNSLILTVFYFTIESQDFKLLDEYKKSKEEAEVTSNAKTSFLSNMSHEIRVPMSTIIGYGQALLDEKELSRDIILKDIKNVTDASSVLKSLIDNIIDITKIENHEFVLKESEYFLENLVFEINSLVPSRIVNEELVFTIDINEFIPKKYYGDAYKLFKVLTYILLNAISNTTYGEVKLTIDGKKDNQGNFDFEFIVSNTGHSMTKTSFDHDFDDFVNIQSDSQNNLDNNKLGVIIAKELLKIIGGEIEFINEKGQGTKYIIRLKQKILDYENIGNIFENNSSGIATSRSIMNLTGKTALVVDDGQVNLDMARKSLEQYNLNIFTVKSGRECLEVVKNIKIDIIFMDHMMPEMDGVTTVKALRSSGRKLPPIVLLTANLFDPLKDEYLANGFDEYLHKPIVFKELNRVMKKYFGEKDI